jgi:ketosteroid isomerase-like protein
MQRDLEKVQDIYDAYERRDLVSVFQLLSKDVEFVQSTELPWGGHYTGHDGVRQFLATLREHVDSRVILERLIDAGDRVVAVGRTVGKACATKLEFDVPVVHVWTLQDGQVTRFEAYIDNATMLAALGM